MFAQSRISRKEIGISQCGNVYIKGKRRACYSWYAHLYGPSFFPGFLGVQLCVTLETEADVERRLSKIENYVLLPRPGDHESIDKMYG